MNNAFLGMTIQKYICQKYDVPMHPNAVAQFTSSYNKDYEPGLDELTNAIFRDIGTTPTQCLTFAPSAKGKETLSPHNFLLENGATLSIRTNKTGDKVAPRVVGQCGLFVFNAFFSELAGFEIEDKEQIKGVVLKSIHRMIPTFLDYLFVSDYTVWVRYDDGEYSYTVFDRNQFVDIETEREHFTFTKDGAAWNESTTLKYKGISIAEIQIHKNRTFKFRFIMKAMQKFLVEAKMTTETFGMTAEKTICDIFGLSYPANFKTRCSARLQEEITPTVKAAFTELPDAIKHTGSEKGERGKESKCSYDFVLAGQKTLSLKTNTGKMVCPPEVGQPGAETCYLYFKHLTDTTEMTGDVFKEMVLNRIAEMMPIYVEHLLDSDYLLWIYKKKDNYEYKIFNSDFAKNMVWDNGAFTFTKPTIEEWNESNTLKYNGISIGEFQVHKARSCFKFRFNMENFEKVIKGTL